MKVEQVLANQLYGTAQRAEAGPQPEDAAGFADALEKALGEMRATVERGERAAMEAMSGEGDLQSVVEALTATEMALETAVVVRDRVVEAYQEIMRMPV
ncbi:MAG: flagellar hook-basal body complex protein FliE [Pseudomonadota bacterium]